MFKRYRIKKDLLPVMEQLQGTLKSRMDQFLYHALVVMVEEAEEHPDPMMEGAVWATRVSSATFMVYNQMMSDKWMFLPVRLALRYHRRHLDAMVLYAEPFITSEIISVLDADLTPLDIIAGADAETWWYMDLLSKDTLPGRLAVQRERLIQTEGSYLKEDGYRRHRNLVLGYQKGNHDLPESIG